MLLDYLTIIKKGRLLARCKNEIVLKEIIDHIHKFNNPVLIFGSAVNSVKNARDVDILIIEKFNKKDMQILEKKLNIKFHLINVKNLKEINEALKQEIKKNI